MLDKLMEILTQYGPFPIGILIGLMIARWSQRIFIKEMELNTQLLRRQLKELHEIIKKKDDRIDYLHELHGSKKNGNDDVHEEGNK